MSEWRIDELAQRAGVAVDTIRYYQREGLLPAGERSGRSMRYGPRHLERLERIRALQARRFSLAAIRELLDHDGGPTSLETMLAGREGTTYDHDELLVAADVPVGARAWARAGRPAPRAAGVRPRRVRRRRRRRAPLLRRSAPPRRSRRRALRAGADPQRRDRIDAATDRRRVPRRTGSRLGPGSARASSNQTTANEPARVVRDMRAIADYVQHRNIQRIVLRELGEPYTEEPDAESASKPRTSGPGRRARSRSRRARRR